MEFDAATNIHIVPDGDCVLIVGPTMVKMQVNSQCLRAASQPFRAMFRPEWREGHDLSSHIQPVEIELPDDDATALQLLFSVIHHQNNTIPETLPSRDVLGVAVAADKYDCIRAMHFASESWLRSDQKTIEDLMVLAAAAYRFGNATAFRKITKRMILDHYGPFTAVAGAEVVNDTDWRILGLLEEARGIARVDFAEILLKGIQDGGCVHRCGWSSKYAYAYLNLLQGRDLWPGAMSRLSLADAILKAETIPDPVPEEASHPCQYDYNHSVPEYRRNRQWHLTHLDSRIGLCLHCVRSGGHNAAHCQSEHKV